MDPTKSEKWLAWWWPFLWIIHSRRGRRNISPTKNETLCERCSHNIHLLRQSKYKCNDRPIYRGRRQAATALWLTDEIRRSKAVAFVPATSIETITIKLEIKQDGRYQSHSRLSQKGNKKSQWNKIFLVGVWTSQTRQVRPAAKLFSFIEQQQKKCGQSGRSRIRRPSRRDRCGPAAPTVFTTPFRHGKCHNHASIHSLALEKKEMFKLRPKIASLHLRPQLSSDIDQDVGFLWINAQLNDVLVTE